MARYRGAWMAGHASTARRVSYLVSLGFTGEIPATAAEASALIDQLKRRA